MSKKNGISLIALIITIIVIVLLAAIVVNTSINTPQSANLAKFMQEMGELQQAVSLSYVDDYVLATVGNNAVNQSDIYQGIARGNKPIGENLTIYEDSLPNGTIAWKIEDASKIDGIDNLPDYNGSDFYLTDEGTVFLGGGYESGGEIYYTPVITESTLLTISDTTPPSAPTTIDYTKGSNNISVTANGGTDAKSGVAGYQYKLGTDGTWTATIAAGTAYNFTNGITASTTYTVYARTVDNVGLISDDINISVKTNDALITNIELSSVSVNGTNKTATIIPTITPSDATNKELTWTSSNTAAVTVDRDSGVVTYKGVGNSIITATAQDGSGVSATTVVISSQTSSYFVQASCGEISGSGVEASVTINLDLTNISTMRIRFRECTYIENATVPLAGWTIYTQLAASGPYLRKEGSGLYENVEEAEWDVSEYTGIVPIRVSAKGWTYTTVPNNAYIVYGRIDSIQMY